MMILHHGWRSSASRRVRLCLEEKGLAYDGHVVDMARLEHHSPEYLRINPLGVIPTLIHDGKPLHESGTICEYLDETFPDPPLRPETPYERAQMRNWIRHIDGLIHNLIIFNWRHPLQKDGGSSQSVRLADRQGLFHHRYRGGSVRETDRRRDRAGRSQYEETSPRQRMVDYH